MCPVFRPQIHCIKLFQAAFPMSDLHQKGFPMRIFRPADASLLLAVPALGATGSLPLFTPGVNNSGPLLPDLSVDPPYTIITSPPASGVSSTAFTPDSSK